MIFSAHEGGTAVTASCKGCDCGGTHSPPHNFNLLGGFKLLFLTQHLSSIIWSISDSFKAVGTCLSFISAVKIVTQQLFLMKVLQSGKCPFCVWSICPAQERFLKAFPWFNP